MIFEKCILQQKRIEQAKLAMALVDNLGLDGAIHACRANGWDGVLDVIRGLEIKVLPDTEPCPYQV